MIYSVKQSDRNSSKTDTFHKSDEEVLAFVQIAEGDTVSVSDLRAFVRERLAGYKRPGQIILATILPAAPTGKILKHRLLERFGDQLD